MREAPKVVIGWVAWCAVGGLGCSSGSASPVNPGVACQGGTVSKAGACVVAERTELPEASTMAGGVSFAVDVQPLFNHFCAVVGCHVSGSPTGMLNLAPDFAYQSLVGVVALQTKRLPGGPLVYVEPSYPDQSYLHIKIHQDIFQMFHDSAPVSVQPQLGTEMPYHSTGSFLDPTTQIALIDQWIAEGAQNN